MMKNWIWIVLIGLKRKINNLSLWPQVSMESASIHGHNQELIQQVEKEI